LKLKEGRTLKEATTGSMIEKLVDRCWGTRHHIDKRKRKTLGKVQTNFHNLLF